jgi:hypothetical protein
MQACPLGPNPALRCAIRPLHIEQLTTTSSAGKSAPPANIPSCVLVLDQGPIAVRAGYLQLRTGVECDRLARNDKTLSVTGDIFRVMLKPMADTTMIPSIPRLCRDRFSGPILMLVLSAGVATHGLGAGKEPDATIEMKELQIAFIGSGNFGDGKLYYKGQTHHFKITGLGVGGFGISEIDASGDVYNLKSLADFPGVYGEARAGVVVGEVGAGHLWLENEKGVVLNLRAEREGLALSLGADGIVIRTEE